MIRPVHVITTLVCALTMSIVPVAASSEESIRYPGLPLIGGAPVPPFPAGNTGAPGSPGGDRNAFSWLNPAFNGLTGSVAARQWTRLPLGTLAANIWLSTCIPEGVDNPGAPCPPGTEASPDASGFLSLYHGAAFIVSPPGSPDAYGTSRLIPVRTVAFGTLPVEVELQVQQVKDANGLPRPAELLTRDYSADGNASIVLDSAELVMRATISIRSLRIDDVDVPLRRTCTTSPTTIKATSRAAKYPESEANRVDLRREVSGILGGGLEGSLDIPDFSGCRTDTGDDISPIVTSAVSGPDNPVFLQYGQTCPIADESGNLVPIPPGVDTPEKLAAVPGAGGCSQNQLDPALNPDNWVVPMPWDIPGVAPGQPVP